MIFNPAPDDITCKTNDFPISLAGATTCTESLPPGYSCMAIKETVNFEPWLYIVFNAFRNSHHSTTLQ